SLSDLRNVHGVGPALVERWRDRVYLSRPEGDEDGEPEVKGGRPTTPNPPPPGGPSRPAVGKKPLAPGEHINVNRAPAEEPQRPPRAARGPPAPGRHRPAAGRPHRRGPPRQTIPLGGRPAARPRHRAQDTRQDPLARRR